MKIVRYNPFWNQALSQFWDEDNWPEPTMTDGLDVCEKDNKIIVSAAMPGIPEENIEITLEDGVLHISGRWEETEEEKKKKKVVYKSQMIKSFDYRTVMPRPVDTTNIKASLKNGILNIEANIAPEAQPKKIKVTSN